MLLTKQDLIDNKASSLLASCGKLKLYTEVQCNPDETHTTRFAIYQDGKMVDNFFSYIGAMNKYNKLLLKASQSK